MTSPFSLRSLTRLIPMATLRVRGINYVRWRHWLRLAYDKACIDCWRNVLCQMNNAFPCESCRSNAFYFAFTGASLRMQGLKWRRNALRGRLKLDSTTSRRPLAKVTSRWWSWQDTASQKARWAHRSCFCAPWMRSMKQCHSLMFDVVFVRKPGMVHLANASFTEIFCLSLRLPRSPLRSSTKLN